MSEPPPGGPQPGPPRSRAWWDALSITAITSADGINQVLMPLLLDDAGYTAAAIGPLIAIVAVASLAARLPVGAVYRPSRARRLLMLSLTTAAACSVLYPRLVGSAPLFLALRVAHGIAIGVATTVNLAFFIDSQPAGSSRSRAMGLYGGGMAAGYTIGNLVGGVAGDSLGYDGAFLVSALFWAAGLCQILTRAARRVDAAPAAVETKPSADRPAPGKALLRALGDPAIVGVTMLAFQLNAILMLGQVYFPLVARDAGLSLAEIGLVRAVHSMVNAIGRPLSTPLVTRLGAGRVSFASFVLQAGAIALIPAVAFGGVPAFTLVFVVVGAGRAIGFTANTIQLAEDIPESRMSRGMSSSLFTAARDVGNIAGPIIGSALISIVGLPLMFLTAPTLLMLVQIGVTSGVRWSARHAPSTTSSTT